MGTSFLASDYDPIQSEDIKHVWYFEPISSINVTHVFPEFIAFRTTCMSVWSSAEFFLCNHLQSQRYVCQKMYDA